MKCTHQIKRTVSRKGTKYVLRGEKCIIHPDSQVDFITLGVEMKGYVKIISLGGHMRKVTPNNLVEL